MILGLFFSILKGNFINHSFIIRKLFPIAKNKAPKAPKITHLMSFFSHLFPWVCKAASGQSTVALLVLLFQSFYKGKLQDFTVSYTTASTGVCLSESAAKPKLNVALLKCPKTSMALPDF